MLRFPSGPCAGHEFRFLTAAGARGFAGHDEGPDFVHTLAGWWKRVWRLPDILPVSKTVTGFDRRGNWSPWAPWRTVWPIGSLGLLNAMGLPNPSLSTWIADYYHLVRDRPFVLSLAPFSESDAESMGSLIRASCPGLAALEANLSCPNVPHDVLTPDQAVRLHDALASSSRLPVIVKLPFRPDLRDFVVALQGAFAIHLINTYPWSALYATPSPLRPLDGGVSGEPLGPISRAALATALQADPLARIISGGGVMDRPEALERFRLGAAAVSLGSVYLLRPWRVRGIVREEP